MSIRRKLPSGDDKARKLPKVKDATRSGPKKEGLKPSKFRDSVANALKLSLPSISRSGSSKLHTLPRKKAEAPIRPTPTHGPKADPRATVRIQPRRLSPLSLETIETTTDTLRREVEPVGDEAKSQHLLDGLAQQRSTAAQRQTDALLNAKMKLLDRKLKSSNKRKAYGKSLHSSLSHKDPCRTQNLMQTLKTLGADNLKSALDETLVLLKKDAMALKHEGDITAQELTKYRLEGLNLALSELTTLVAEESDPTEQAKLAEVVDAFRNEALPIALTDFAGTNVSSEEVSGNFSSLRTEVNALGLDMIAPKSPELDRATLSSYQFSTTAELKDALDVTLDLFRTVSTAFKPKGGTFATASTTSRIEGLLSTVSELDEKVKEKKNLIAESSDPTEKAKLEAEHAELKAVVDDFRNEALPIALIDFAGTNFKSEDISEPFIELLTTVRSLDLNTVVPKLLELSRAKLDSCADKTLLEREHVVDDLTEILSTIEYSCQASRKHGLLLELDDYFYTSVLSTCLAPVGKLEAVELPPLPPKEDLLSPEDGNTFLEYKKELCLSYKLELNDFTHWRNVFGQVYDAATSQTTLTLEMIQDWHSELFDHSGTTYYGTEELNPRDLRQPGQTVSKGEGSSDKYDDYASPNCIEKESKRFIAWLNEGIGKVKSGEMDATLLASQVRRTMVSMHLFLDGNHRMADLIQDFVLMSANLTPSVVELEGSRTWDGVLGREPCLSQGSSADLRGYIIQGMNIGGSTSSA